MNEHEHHPTSGIEPHHDESEELHPLDAVMALSAASTNEVHTISLDDGPLFTESNVSAIREGIHRYGQPFLAYLILDGVEQRSPDLIEQYEQRYVGSFPDRRSFAEWAIADQGWAKELVALQQLQGMWPDDVKWDIDRLWLGLVERYALTERLGGVHAFRR